jgi:hypothetical protein
VIFIVVLKCVVLASVYVCVLQTFHRIGFVIYNGWGYVLLSGVESV